MKRYTRGAFVLGAVLSAAAALAGWQAARAQQTEPQSNAPDAMGTPGSGRAEAPRAQLGTTTPAVDPQAAAILQRMGNYLASLRSFAVRGDSMTEVVANDGHKLQILASSAVYVDRPNKLRSERHGPMADLTFYYDGHTIALYDQRRDVYASTPAPRNMDHMIDYAREQLGIEAPGADLLYTDVYQGLMDGVRSGEYIGEEEVEGRVCHHLAFRDDDVDWQIWVEAGDRPVPRRYVIVTKDVQSQPEYSVDLHDWNTDAKFPSGFFDFQPPPGAQRIQFLGNARATG